MSPGQAVTFAGTAVDAEDGNLSDGLAWTSDRDGALGTGASITRSDLSLGAHVITASATDSGGRTGSDQIDLAVTNKAPTVTITAPPTNWRVAQGNPVTFAATATDPEDGDVSANVIWTSSKDGQIGTGASITLSNLSKGRHRITASVTDGAGKSDSDDIKLRITR